ncbi:hypothetical protein BKK79_29090 [Cupriavidus sp. USMAA2-4]|nr:hypothetical protein BKK79_29090 [Cupriavidus sp. USMAA2-4]
MSIGDRPRNILAGYPSVRSGPVIDDHLLSEQTPDAGSDEVSHSVIATACACRKDDLQRLRARSHRSLCHWRGPGENVVGQMEFTSHDFSGRSNKRCSSYFRGTTFALQFDFDFDPPSGMKHHEGMSASVPFVLARDGTRQCEGAGHADRSCNGMRGMALARSEVARCDAIARVARADQHWLRNDAVRHIAEAHQQAGLQSQRLQSRQQCCIAVERGRCFTAADAQVAGPDNHQRHGRVDASHLDAIDHIDAFSRWEYLACHGTPGIQKIKQDRRAGSSDTVDAGVTVIGYPAIRRTYGHVNSSASIDVMHAYASRVALDLDETLLDGERRDA